MHVRITIYEKRVGAMRMIWGLMILGIAGGIIGSSGDSSSTPPCRPAAAHAVTISITLVAARPVDGDHEHREGSGHGLRPRARAGPVTRRLFRHYPRKRFPAHKYISLNLSANVLGSGNAALCCIRAMEELQRYNRKPRFATNAMCMLLIVNILELRSLTGDGIARVGRKCRPAAIALSSARDRHRFVFAVALAKLAERYL